MLKRDGYRCTRCGHDDTTGKSLAAHHVRHGYTADCGVTLCHPCHREVDRHARG